MKRLKINDFCSIRMDGPLYCLTDLYNVMDMRNDRSAPFYWAHNRSGIRIVKKGLFRKPYFGPSQVVYQRGLFRKTYWASAAVLVDYATSLTPVTAKDVREAVGMRLSEPAKPLNARIVPPSPSKSRLEILTEGLTPPVNYPLEQNPLRTKQPERRQPARRAHPQPATRGFSHGSRSSQNDAMIAQMLVMDSVLNEPSRSRSVDTSVCEAPRHSHSSSDDSSRHSYSSHSSHSHSSHDYGSYDSGSSSDSGGGGGCD